MNMKKLLYSQFALLFILTSAFVFASLPSEGAQARNGVISFSPTGKVSNNIAFKVVFSDGMAAKDVIGKVLPMEEFPFTVTPEVRAEGKWLDNRTFSASLLAPLNMGTVYTAKFRDTLTNLKRRSVGGGRTFQFQTDALALKGVRAVDMLNGRLSIVFEFNMPVQPSHLRGFLRLTRENGEQINYSVEDVEPSTRLRVFCYFGRNVTGPVRIYARLSAGLTGAVGTLGLTKDVAQTLDFRPRLTIENLTGRNAGIQVETNLIIDEDSAADFISIEPDVAFSVVSTYYDGVVELRGDFLPRQRYVLTFKKGLPVKGGDIVLDEEHRQAIIMPDLPPTVELPEPGMFLSPVGGGLVPVELTNVSRLHLALWRLYESNIPYILRTDGTPWFQQDLARRVYNKELQLSLPLNETVRRSIPLGEMLSQDRGLFLLTLTEPELENWYERRQIINYSDLGAVVRLWEDGVMVWVNTLSELKPVEQAHVRLYSTAGQILAEGKTDADGLWVLRRGETWGTEEDRTPLVVTVSLNDDVTFVRLNRRLLSQEIFDTAGRPWIRSGYDAVLFSARDIYRTGEQADFKAIVRETAPGEDLRVPRSFPVLFVISDPLGRAVRRETVLLSDEGGAVCNLDIPTGARTGGWSVQLCVPGDEEHPLARMAFSVEDFAPPRIEVKLSSEADTLAPGDDMTLNIQARYLFGANGADLKWEASWQAWQGQFTPQNPRWKPFTFGDPTRRFSGDSDVFAEGTLDGNGAAKSKVTLPDFWSAPALINVMFTGRVREEGGRWVARSITLPYYPSEYLLGLATADEQAAVGRDMKFKAAAINPHDESPVDPGELTATLYRVVWNYNLVRLDGYSRWQSSEEHIKVESKTLTLEDGVGEISFRPDRWGDYLLQVSDETSDARVSFRFYASDPQYAGQGGSQLMDRVELEPDKETYHVGDTARITVRAPFEGLLLFNVEAQSLIDRHIVRVDKAETVIEVPVTKEMVPNAWCAAWLIRPLKEEAQESARRAIGVTRLTADLSEFRLAVKLDAPDKIDPARRMPVTVSLTDAEGSPADGEIAIALVDDGVLGLTGYQAPDPVDYFFGKREMNSNGYDFYDLLMSLESRATELLHPSGGSAADRFAGGGQRAQRFKILSLFEGTVPVDASGTARLFLEIPEFSGRGRLSVVAASGGRFGKGEKTVQIARDVVTEADLPRFAAPGDVFTAPVSVFNSGGQSLDITVELSALGELAVSEDADANTNTKILSATVPGGDSWKSAVSLTALNPGTGAYIVTTRWETAEGDEKSFVQSFDLPVRSPFPVISMSGSGHFESGDSEIAVPRNAFAGPITGSLTLVGTPLVNLTRAMNFLTNYPYGCLEQTISSAWPFLTLPDALAQIDPLLVNNAAVKRKTASAIERIQSMQLFDGSFTSWPGGSAAWPWGSVYATHFLIEARDAGVDYPPEMLRSALNYLKQYLASLPGNSYKGEEHDDFTTKAYAVFVLALNGEKPLGWLHYLEENRDNMWPSGRIWLVGARARIEGRADALRELGIPGDDNALTPNALFQTLDSEVRNTALLLSLWAEVEPRSAETVRLVQRLLDWGKQNRWHSTQENAAVTLALGRYLSRAGYEKSDLSTVLKDDDMQPLATFKSGEKTALDINALPESPWFLSTTGTGTGYYSWVLSGTPAESPAPEKRGVALSLRWTDRNGVEINRAQPVDQGMEIRAVLTLTPLANVKNLVVSCLLPAGMEIENPRLLPDGVEPPFGVRYDVRDDRLLIFINSLSEKTDYRFSMRAVTRGTFAMPPLAAEGMYDPEIRFIGEAGKTINIR